MQRELFDHDGRLFVIDDTSSGWVWAGTEWREISDTFARRVWIEGTPPDRPLTKFYGADDDDLPGEPIEGEGLPADA